MRCRGAPRARRDQIPRKFLSLQAGRARMYLVLVMLFLSDRGCRPRHDDTFLSHNDAREGEVLRTYSSRVRTVWWSSPRVERVVHHKQIPSLAVDHETSRCSETKVRAALPTNSGWRYTPLDDNDLDYVRCSQNVIFYVKLFLQRKSLFSTGRSPW